MGLGNLVFRALTALWGKLFRYRVPEWPEVFVGESARTEDGAPPLRVQAYRLTPRVFAVRLLQRSGMQDKLSDFRAPVVRGPDGTARLAFGGFELSADFSVRPAWGRLRRQPAPGDEDTALAVASPHDLLLENLD